MSTQFESATQPTREKLPRKLKKAVKKASPVSSRPSISRAPRAPKPRSAKRAVEAKSAQAEATQVVRTPHPRTVASVARKLLIHLNDTSPAYKRLLDKRRSVQKLAREVLEDDVFALMLVKYKGFDALVLTEMAIRCLREDTHTTAPAVTPKQAKTPRSGKRPLTERQILALQKSAPQPAVKAPSARTPRKGAPKSIPRRHQRGDQQVTTEALDALLQADPQLKQLLCQASLVEAKRALRTDDRLLQFMSELRRQLAAPSRACNYTEAAIRSLTLQYRTADMEAEREAQEAAEAKRASQRAAAIEASAANVIAINRKNSGGAMPRSIRRELSKRRA